MGKGGRLFLNEPQQQHAASGCSSRDAADKGVNSSKSLWDDAIANLQWLPDLDPAGAALTLEEIGLHFGQEDSWPALPGSRAHSPELIQGPASFTDAFHDTGILPPHVPAFGTLAVDDLFASNPYDTSALSPPLLARTPSPPLSELRRASSPSVSAFVPVHGGDAGRSPEVAAHQSAPEEAHPEPRRAASGPTVGHGVPHPASRSTIFSAFASDGSTGARVVVSRAPKRKGPELHSESEESAASEVTVLEEAPSVRAPSVARRLSTFEEVEAALQCEDGDGIAKAFVTSGCEEVTISPTVLRLVGGGLLVCLGLKTDPAKGFHAPVTAYDHMNPQVVTTGRPSRQGGVAASKSQRSLALLPPTTRQRGTVKQEREVLPDIVPAASATCKEQFALEALWLLQRRLDTGQVTASHVITGDFQESTAVTAPVDWSQDDAFAVDVVASLRAPCGDSFWIKALGRNVIDFQ